MHQDGRLRGYHVFFILGATEDAINAAREAFHAHLAATQKTQQQSHDTSEEDLSQLDERELDAEFAGKAHYGALMSPVSSYNN